MKERSNVLIKIVNSPETDTFTLKYFITKQESSFGIEIEKYIPCEDGERFIERESVSGITDEYSKIEFLTFKLARNYVTPTTLVAIVDDFISEF